MSILCLSSLSYEKLIEDTIKRDYEHQSFHLLQTSLFFFFTEPLLSLFKPFKRKKKKAEQKPTTHSCTPPPPQTTVFFNRKVLCSRYYQ